MNPSSRTIHFTKASACGNDFLIVAGTEASGELNGLTRRLCDRHNGVGADGVEWIFPEAEADAMARLINADGSEAEISATARAAWPRKFVRERRSGKLRFGPGRD